MNSDSLNPMVIKELRQGLKSKSFLATFLGLQAAMVLSMFIYLSSASTNSGMGSMDFADGFFWFMLGLMLLVFMPLRAFGALNEEIKGNTLEMLFLTRMDAWKISFGKWCALVIQIFLLVSAVLPYLVLRYFLGAIDIAGNLEQLFYQIMASMLFVSVGVGLSAWTSRIMRGLIIIGALLSLYMVPFFLLSVSMSGGGSRGSFALFGWVEVLVGMGVAGILMMLFVEYGASQIAPPAENHALRKRGLALLLSLILCLYAAFFDQAGAGVVMCLVVLIPIAIDALCEPLIGIKSLYVKLRKFRAARWLFYPGWVSGFLFVSLLFWTLFTLLVCLEGDEDIWLIGLVAYNTLIFPFACIRLFAALGRKALVTYFSVQVLSFAFCLLMIFLEEIHFISNFIVLGHLVPMLGFFVIAIEDVSDFHPWLLFFPTAVMLTLTLVKACRPLMQMQYLSKGEEG
ncbi:hypothetical protein P0Y35_12735 [Kiritimatiellaeota bacterium B1221]|nr:hypothetical protein [Kiritimatiellaeota bacterium B1221]